MIDKESPRTEKEKDAAIKDGIQAVLKEHGPGAIFNMNERVGRPMPHLPTGIWEVDYDVLGIGGMPRGRIIEILGPESGGKTTLALTLVAQAQANNERCLYVDAEHSFDPNWATTLGVNVSKLMVAQPDYGEQALDIADTMLETQALSVLVIDSVAALTPKAELDGEIGDAVVGAQARLMSQAMRRLTAKVNKSGAILVFINQIREKIGVSWGSPETTSGGRALKFYASVRLDVRRIAGVKHGDSIEANRVRIKAVKNKVAPPFKEAEIDLVFSSGFDRLGSLVNAAVRYNVVQKSGSWYSFGAEKLGQGAGAVAAAIAVSPELETKVRDALDAALKGQPNA